MNAVDRPGGGPAADEGGATGQPSPPDAGPAGSLGQLGGELAELFGAAFHLLGAESRLFASTLLLIAGLAVLAGLLTVAAVVLSGVAVALALVRHGGLDPVVATSLVVVALLAATAGIFWWIRGLSGHLRFRHSRRMLVELASAHSTMEDRK